MNIFLDLDGTLVDSAPGITASIAHALSEIGAEVPPAEELLWCIGPPLRQSFETLLGPGADIEAAFDAYREAYIGGLMFEADLYDGVGEMLEALRATGAGLWVATSKTRDAAVEIAEEFGISHWVDGVFGAEPDGSLSHKPELLAHAIAATEADPERSVMIGDRRFDIEGARANRLASIGALWGFSDEGELRLAEADALAAHPSEIAEIVGELIGGA